MATEPERLPDFLTVEEAARVLRIGRTAAYALTRQWRATGEGLPVVKFGRLLRVPRAAIEAVAGGPITAAPSEPSAPKQPPTPSPHPRRRDRRTTRTSPRQPSLFQDPT